MIEFAPQARPILSPGGQIQWNPIGFAPLVVKFAPQARPILSLRGPIQWNPIGFAPCGQICAAGAPDFEPPRVKFGSGDGYSGNP